MKTQLIQQAPNSTFSRSAGTNDRAVRYRKLKSRFFTDTMFATKKAKGLCENTCCQVFVSDCDFLSLYPTQQESEHPLVLKQFSKEVGAPDVFVCDCSKTQNQRKVKLLCTQMVTTLKTLDAGLLVAIARERFVRYAHKGQLRMSNC